MKATETPNCISLDQTIAPRAVLDPQRTFINCLPSNDLEFRFLGTIFCEMDDLDQISPGQTLIHLWDCEKRVIVAQFYVSERVFDCLKL